MMCCAFADSPTAASACLISVVVTFMETNTETATRASHPKTAVFQWLALQRPMRAAMFLDCCKGDISFLLSAQGLQVEGLVGRARNRAARRVGERVVVGLERLGGIDAELELLLVEEVEDDDLHVAGVGA